VNSYRECTARQRLAHLLDAGTLEEFVPPGARIISPHLAQLNAPASFDDGVVIGRALLQGAPVYVAAQEGGFMGGAVGEVHGAKLTGLLLRAMQEPDATRPQAVLLLLESGGVRLHEANAGLIAVSEVMRALLAVRAAGIAVIVLIGGANGCFGGIGIVARCANWIVMSEEARLAMSGPEVIETTHGVEEFDSRDRALVWRTTGGKHRYLLGDCDVIVADDVDAFRQAALDAIQACRAIDVGLTLAGLVAEQAILTHRLQAFGGYAEPMEIWCALGLTAQQAAHLPMLEAVDFAALAAPHRLSTQWMESDQVVNLANSINAATEAHVASALPAQAGGDDVDDWQAVAAQLFPQGHTITQQGYFLSGTGQVGGQTMAVIGTCGHTPIGVEIALAQARAVLDVVRTHPGRPLLILVDTQGQRLRHRDEMLGINSYMAHLGKCIELARQRQHKVLALVYGQALSGGFLTSGMMADACYALPQAVIRVMGLAAMARITKIPEETLTALAQTNPVFAPGPENYVRMGGLAALWDGDLAQHLADALAEVSADDQRSQLGLVRGGRQMAQRVIEMVVRGVTVGSD
jgi:malonate decarboxylase beta subunit